MKYFWAKSSALQAAKHIVLSCFGAAILLASAFLTFKIAGLIYVNIVATSQLSLFSEGLAADIEHLKTQGDAVARNNQLINSVIAKDRENVLAIIRRERREREIGLMGVADKNGVILGRTLSIGKYGDNVFLTAPAGRVVSTGKEVQSIEMTGFGNQIFITTARPLLMDKKMVGALFSNRLLDDHYAKQFKSKYLAPSTEIVFYSREFGVFGDSFTDIGIKKDVSSYFNSGSDWVRGGLNKKTVVFENGKAYNVENIVFSGLENTVGGALIFIPRQDVVVFSNAFIIILLFILFVLLSLFIHLSLKTSGKGWKHNTVIISVGVILITAVYAIFQYEELYFIRLHRVPYALYNSTIRLQPDFGIYNIETEQRYSVFVDSGDESINAVGFEILFDPKAVEVKTIDTTNSSCSYVINTHIDQDAGLASLSCVILDKGLGQRSFQIADIVLVPKRTGTFKLGFSENTRILADDGLGTDVLRLAQEGSYRVDNFNFSVSSDKDAAKNAGRSFIIFSPTHPNESRWYNSPTVRFVWRGIPGAEYRYIFDQNSNTIPSDGTVISGESIDVPTPMDDGIYYFHLQLKSGGPIAHYRIQSDRTSPKIVAINSSSDTVSAGDVVRFTFDAEDSESGIQKNYYVTVGSHVFLPVGSQLFVPFVQPGVQSLTLRVYDAAGNYTEATKKIYVEEK